MALLISKSLEDFPKTIVVSDPISMGAVEIKAANNYSIELITIFQGKPWPATERGMQLGIPHAKALSEAIQEMALALGGPS